MIPYLKAAGEAKTKPTQHSVGQLRQIGIQPDILICRTEREFTEDMARKSPCSAMLSERRVIEERDKDVSIYEVPMSLVENRLDELIVEKLTCRPSRWTSPTGGRCCSASSTRPTKSPSRWSANTPNTTTLTNRSTNRSTCGHRLAEPRGGRRIEAEDLEARGAGRLLSGVDGILVPGGFG